jgi:hypothetical protein
MARGGEVGELEVWFSCLLQHDTHRGAGSAMQGRSGLARDPGTRNVPSETFQYLQNNRTPNKGVARRSDQARLKPLTRARQSATIARMSHG